MVYNKKETAYIYRKMKTHNVKQLKNMISNIDDAIEFNEASASDKKLNLALKAELATRSQWEHQMTRMTQREIDIVIAIENGLM